MAAARKKVAAKKVATKKARVLRKVAVTAAVAELGVPTVAPRRPRRVAATSGPEAQPHPSYFADSETKGEHMDFVSTGCTTVDLALSGGFVCGRIANVVGDRSAGKTLMAMELCANFAMKYPGDPVRYDEAENAFDMPYAKAMSIPTDQITFNPAGTYTHTVENLYENIEAWLDKHKKRKRSIYIIDSLDALSDAAELDRDFDEGSFGGTKPKAISKLFRLLTTRMAEQGCLLVVVSQLRDNVGAMFGEKHKRSGGRALDFYATHIVWLREKGAIEKTIGGIKRPIGIHAEAYVKKNKIGLPKRKAEYDVLYGYGTDDMTSSVEWLIKHGREDLLKQFGLSKSGYDLLLNKIRNEGGERARLMRSALAKVVTREWELVETTFLPKASKYGS